MNSIHVAVKAASKSRTAIVAALVSFVAFLLIIVYSTIVTTPGNTLELWIRFTSTESKILVLLLAAGLGLLFGLLAYSFKQKVGVKRAGLGAVGVGSGIIAVIAAMFGTAACLGCLAAVFGFLGVGTLVTLIGFQTPMLIAGLLVTLVSIYFISGSIASDCIECKPSSNGKETK